ncbi:MAG: phosphate ABC transporter permease subunit PstC [Candidatus Melainabacteria bacterium]|nr:phosphate ABC transporter permease subunit PstC [Candidatus Melainabacteria bacterium]
MAQLFFVSAFLAVVSLLLIAIYVFYNGLKIFKVVKLQDFLFGYNWEPVTLKLFGILPMIITSFYVTFGAIIVSAPLGIACAIFLAEIAPLKAQRIIRPAVQLLAGIPSVIYGLFGLTFIVPLIQTFSEVAGLCILAAIIILSIMILPTIISIAEDSIRAVPKELKESSIALGTTKWQTIYGAILPASKSGLITAVILALGRAFGEAMAVKMVIGNTQTMPDFSPNTLFGLLSLARTLTTNIIGDIEYAEPGPHLQALFATGVILFVFIILINGVSYLLLRKSYGASKV